jgi:hypothetical protein
MLTTLAQEAPMSDAPTPPHHPHTADPAGPRRQESDAIRSATQPLRRGLWILTAAWLATVAFTVPRLTPSDPPIQQVIRVERLEIVEPDGTLSLVLANSQRPAVATLDGKPIMANQAAERRYPTMIFFDGQGDEVGGMLFQTGGTPDAPNASRQLTLDGWKQDQTVVLLHHQNQRGSQSGLSVSDRPKRHMFDNMADLGLQPGAARSQFEAALMALPEETRQQRMGELFGVTRLFVGSNWNDVAVLQLNDGRGRPRMIIGVPADGAPFIRMLDENGRVTMELPERPR